MKLKLHRLLDALTVCLTPATVALSGMIAPSALAASGTWTGTAGDNLYQTAGNWSGAAAPTVNDDIATWNGTQSGALSILWNAQVGGFSGNGVSLVLTGSQTSAVTLNNTANNSSFGLTGISIGSGAGAFTIGGATGNPIVLFRTGATGGSTTPVLMNDSTANTATIKANVILSSGGAANRALTFDGAGNWQVDAQLATAGAGALTVVKNGVGTLKISNANASQNYGYTVNTGTLVVGGAGRLGGPSGVFGGTVAITGTLSYESSASQTISSGITGTGALAQSAGTLTLTGNNTHSGTTTVTGGTMVLSGSGQMATSSLTINGPSAKFVQTGSVASTVPITLIQGIVDGTGSVGSVTVNGSGGTVRNGNGGTAALAIGSLSFGSGGNINFAEDGMAATPGVIVTGALVAGGGVTVNASQTTWASGTTFDLLTFGSFAGTLLDFTKGTISGLSSRQTAALVLGANKLSLQIIGYNDNVAWTGLDNGTWSIGSTGASGNWKLIPSGTQTDYVAGDPVLFDDTVATGTTAVNIPMNVSPALVTFHNSTKDYTFSGAAGIATGSVIKTGTGKVTFSAANTYAGGTTASAGTLALSGAGTLGATTGALTVNGTGIVDLGTTSQSVGAVFLFGTGAITNGTITPTSVSSTSASAAVLSASIAGSGSVMQTGSGSLTLSGANSYTGGTTISSGCLLLSGAGTLGATTGVLNLGGATLDLGTTSQTVGTVTVSEAATISNGSLAFSVFNDTHTTGTATVSAKLTGTGALNVGGLLFLTGANDYTGPTVIGSILQLGDGGTRGSLSPSSTITLANGGRFSTRRSDTITQGVDFGLLTGGGNGIEHAGTGTTVFNLANTYTTGGVMWSGTVVAASNQALGTGAVFNIIGGSLHLKDDITLPLAIRTHGEAVTSDTAGSIVSTGANTLSGAVGFEYAGTGNVSNIISLSGTLTATGALTANAGGRTINFGGAGNVVVAGAITSSVAVSKSGSGTTTLSSANGNTYTGGTTILNGTLRIQGSNATAGATTINGTGAVLAGTGSIGGDVTITSGAIAPGDGVTAIGTLTLGNDLHLSPTASTFNMDLSSVDNTSDSVNIGNKLFNGGGTVTFNFSGGKVGETYTLLHFATTDIADASTYVATGGTGTFNITGTALTYTVQTVVPDYATWSVTNAGGGVANLDYDQDGVPNGVEYFMGQTGSSFTANPGLVGGTVIWQKDPAYLGTYAVQTSSDLVNWLPASPAPELVGNTVQYTPGTGLGKVFIRLVVTPN